VKEHNCRPIIPLRKLGKTDPPECAHGHWTFAGADFKRKRTKYRCPTGQCATKSRWLAADRTNPLTDLVMLARLSRALARARAVRLAA
jgi:hypothetical protein